MHLIRPSAPVSSHLEPLPDGAILSILRGAKVEETLRIGPNEVHAFITHPDGSITDLGVSHNLLTTAGRDLFAAAQGHATMKGGALTASSSTSATPSGGGMTSDQYKGWRIICPVTGLTTQPVYGNIGTNSTTVITVDQWWTEADVAGTTPASTNGYIIMPTGTPRFMGITADSAAASSSDTTLASEQTTNGLARALATYAHTGGTATYTLQKAFSVTGTVANLHKIGLFTAKDTTSGGVLVFEAVLNADASVANGDTLTCTDTITLS
jgi:hypothetical protein